MSKICAGKPSSEKAIRGQEGMLLHPIASSLPVMLPEKFQLYVCVYFPWDDGPQYPQ